MTEIVKRKKNGNIVVKTSNDDSSVVGMVTCKLRDTENGLIAKFPSHSRPYQDYYVCLDYAQAYDLMLALNKHFEEEVVTIKEKPDERQDEKLSCFDWSCVPDDVKYIAMDKNEEWYGYCTKPENCRGYWETTDYGAFYICHLDYPTGTFTNKNSLMKRPEQNEDKPSPSIINWNDVPPKYDYVAMDKSGCWYLFENKPNIPVDKNYWWDSVGNVEQSSISYTSYVGNWKDSLQQRPSSMELQ